MILNLYSIYDKKAKAYARPFFMQNDATATRAVLSSLEGTDLGMFPNDYTLFCIGTFDDLNGHIESNINHPRQVATILEISRTLEYIKTQTDDQADDLVEETKS